MPITDKYNCGNCDFWLEDPALAVVGKGLITHDSGKPVVLKFGHCRKDPPAMMMGASPHPMDPRQMQMKLQRVFPITQPGEVCSHHPILHADAERGIEALREAARREYLDYRPGKNPDEIAAGFSRVPTLDEAKRIARGADAKRGEPVPDPQPLGES